MLGAASPVAAGTAVVQREGELPKIDHLTAMEQKLLAGALEKPTVGAAVRQIYDNMHAKTGWRYDASARTVNGAAYTKGAIAVGMCESYRNAFAEALRVYDGLRRAHPTPAVRDGELTIEPDDTFVADRFATRQGLTLMGGLKGNVYSEVDGTGVATATGEPAINRFVFKGHWTTKVNGVVYDPIFHSIGENNIGRMLDGSYQHGGGRYIPVPSRPVPTGEFGATFIWVSDWATFHQTVTDLTGLYGREQKMVDKILAGQASTRSGVFTKKDRPAYAQAKALVAGGVGAANSFLAVVTAASQIYRTSEIAAVRSIISLAGK